MCTINYRSKCGEWTCYVVHVCQYPITVSPQVSVFFDTAQLLRGQDTAGMMATQIGTIIFTVQKGMNGHSILKT